MQPNEIVIKKISPLVRFLILVLLSICIVLSKSIYLVLFLTTLVIILTIVSFSTVNQYVKFIKNIFIVLLIFAFLYIITCSDYDVYTMIEFIYKEFLIITLVKLFDMNTTFNELHQAIFGILKTLKFLNIEKASLNIALSIYLIKFYIDSKSVVQQLRRDGYGLKIPFWKIIPLRISHSISEFEKFVFRLKLNFYKLRYKKSNVKSKLLLLVFIILFIICLFKEVI